MKSHSQPHRAKSSKDESDFSFSFKKVKLKNVDGLLVNQVVSFDSPEGIGRIYHIPPNQLPSVWFNIKQTAFKRISKMLQGHSCTAPDHFNVRLQKACPVSLCGNTKTTNAASRLSLHTNQEESHACGSCINFRSWKTVNK